MDYLIIKLYLNEIDPDWHDINMDTYNSELGELDDYAKSMGKKLFFASLHNGGGVDEHSRFRPFAEVEYTGILSEDEKKRYIEYLKKLSIDAQVNHRGNEIIMKEFCALSLIRFKRIEDDIYAV